MVRRYPKVNDFRNDDDGKERDCCSGSSNIIEY